MKKTTAKIVTISDLVRWHSEPGGLQLSPRYQRNSVWNETAKAYLIDTIIRGLPIPPIFLRQTIDITTRTANHEIIDGQQRVRAILDFVVAESFAIKKSHNKEFGGKKYSDLEPEMQEMILGYEIIAEVVVEKDDSIIYDMFARLNSNNLVLNKQEIRNSKYWGEFKVLVYRLSSQYRDFFLSTKLLNDKDCARMRDAELINSLLIVLLEGIVEETPTSIENVYKKYDKEFSECESIESKFRSIMDVMDQIYSHFNGASGCFGNKNYFFTLYCVLANQMFGVSNADLSRVPMFAAEQIESNIPQLNKILTQFIIDYEANIDDKDNFYGLYVEYTEFAKHHKVRTTSKNERFSRIAFLNNAIERAAANDNE